MAGRPRAPHRAAARSRSRSCQGRFPSPAIHRKAPDLFFGPELAPALPRLVAPALVARASAGAQSLPAESQLLLLIDATQADDAQARAELAWDDGHPEVGHLTASEAQRHEDVVVHNSGRPAYVYFRIDRDGRAKELHRLVYQIGAQVEEQSPASSGSARSRQAPAFGSGRKRSKRLSKRTMDSEQIRRDEMADGEEVIVPASILEDGEELAGALGGGDEELGLGAGRREGLVYDHRQAGIQRSDAQGNMRAVGSRDDDQIEVAGADHMASAVSTIAGSARKRALRLLLALSVGGDDSGHTHAGGRLDQWAWKTAPASP